MGKPRIEKTNIHFESFIGIIWSNFLTVLINEYWWGLEKIGLLGLMLVVDVVVYFAYILEIDKKFGVGEEKGESDE